MNNDLKTFLEAFLTATVPNRDDRDDAIDAGMMNFDKVYHAYYSPIVGEFVYSLDLLDLDSIESRRLYPCSIEGIAKVFIPYFNDNFASDSVQILVDPMSPNKRGCIIHTNTRRNRSGDYQVTVFDKDGLITHEIASDLVAALYVALKRHCYQPMNVDTFEAMTDAWSIGLDL